MSTTLMLEKDMRPAVHSGEASMKIPPHRPIGRASREVSAMRIMWRGLELPTRVLRQEVSASGKYARFAAEPFERGFGTTVGNSLRRILLSSLEGAAVTSVKITGVQHEFSSLPGVMEDVTDVILNLKSLIVRLSAEGTRTMRLEVRGKKGESTVVRASDIETDATVEVLNQDQHICTLTDAVTISAELKVDKGRGYRTAEENAGPEREVGVIPVDSVFTPVTRVRYRVEETRVGQRVNYDRLILEIWTKGTVAPDMALVEAAKILRKHLNPFVQYFDVGHETTVTGPVEAAPDMPVDDEMQRKLNMRIADLDLSVRASNCLESAKINTIGDLLRWNEPDLLKLRSFGKTSLREVKRKLADHGLQLGMRVGLGGGAPVEAAAGGDGHSDTGGK